MTEPCITINLEKIEHNARTLTEFCREHGIQISGVSKVACGNPDVANAMLRGGVTSIGESRMRNIHRLKANGVNADFVLLRTPPLSDPDSIVTSVDISLNSELSVIAALSESALRRGLVHKIIIMLDVGDLREGVLPEDLFTLTRDVIELEGVKIVGLGTNLSCYGGVVPSVENMNLLVYYADQLESRFNLQLQYLSGGNSSSIDLITSGKMPQRINHLRLGESILLGRETINRQKVPGTYQDCFLLKAEIIELKEKPSLPIGETAQDAFGNRPVFEDKGTMLRAILNIGREDIDVEGITPIDPRITILGASSDHLLLDVSAASDDIKLGDRVEFTANYSALLAGMTSNYVEKIIDEQSQTPAEAKGVVLLGVAPSNSEVSPLQDISPQLTPEFSRMGLQIEQIPDITAKADEPAPTQPSFLQQKNRLLQTSDSVAMAVKDSFARQRIPIVFSSEPAESLGVYKGLPTEKEQLGLIVFSAYGGFTLPEDDHATDAENISKMVLASALGYRSPELHELTGRSARTPLFKAENVVLIGLRSLGEAEGQRISDSMINVFTMEDIDAFGMKEVCYRAIRAASLGTSGIHVSCNMSVMDMREASGILNPVVGGISYRETHLAMEIISQSGLLRSVDITGFSPFIGPDEVISNVAAGLTLSLCGKRILGKRQR